MDVWDLVSDNHGSTSPPPLTSQLAAGGGADEAGDVDRPPPARENATATVSAAGVDTSAEPRIVEGATQAADTAGVRPGDSARRLPGDVTGAGKAIADAEQALHRAMSEQANRNLLAEADQRSRLRQREGTFHDLAGPGSIGSPSPRRANTASRHRSRSPPRLTSSDPTSVAEPDLASGLLALLGRAVASHRRSLFGQPISTVCTVPSRPCRLNAPSLRMGSNILTSLLIVGRTDACARFQPLGLFQAMAGGGDGLLVSAGMLAEALARLDIPASDTALKALLTVRAHLVCLC